ncbi:MAG TPA: tetratricopeptide repeat protein [Chloroflexota bacterium]|nr:tetratricopeptide repeat protein [Chloroflexota bacterium]
MAAREANLRDQEEDALAQRLPAREKISLVVDRPSSGEGALLILPFAAPRGEEVFGRQLAQVLQSRLRALPNLVVGHGQLLASVGNRRRYVPLHRTLSLEQVRTCGAGWGAAYVLYGTIALRPTLRWSLIVREPGSGKVLFEDTLVGEPHDILDAPGDVALAVVAALGLAVDEPCQEQLGRRETDNLEAMLAFLRALDLRPTHGVEHGDAEALYAGLLRALTLDSTFRPPLDLLVAGAIGGDEGTTPEDLLTVLREIGAEGAAAGAVLARELEEQGHNTQAEAVATIVLDHEPAHIAALAVVMRLAYQARDIPRARAFVHAVLDLEPEHAGAHEMLGNLLATSERFPGAAIHWEVALEQNHNQPKVLMRLGSYLVAAGEYQRAYELLSEALELGTVTPDALYKLGIAAYRLGRAGEAIAPLHRALQREPERAHIHALLARCYQRLGRDDLARVYDARALQIAPTYWPSALALGHGALNQGQTAEALEAYTTVVRIRPDLPEALYGWGIALVASNLIAEGVEALSRAHDLAPDSVPVLCALAMAQLKYGNLEAARQAVDLAETLDPNSTDVEYCLHELAGYQQS